MDDPRLVADETIEESAYWARARRQMISEQIERRGIRDRRVLEALNRVPRHRFVNPALRRSAYEDRPLPAGAGQTISQPYIVALMTELLRLGGDEAVLEIGTGSGYQAAVLGCLARSVYTVEFNSGLARAARERLAALGFSNVLVCEGDGSVGLASYAPYAGILVSAAAPAVPPPLLEQLADQGRLVLPVGDRYGQRLELWGRFGERFRCRRLAPVAFVPLRGAYGWEG